MKWNKHIYIYRSECACVRVCIIRAIVEERNGEVDGLRRGGRAAVDGGGGAGEGFVVPRWRR